MSSLMHVPWSRELHEPSRQRTDTRKTSSPDGGGGRHYALLVLGLVLIALSAGLALVGQIFS